MNLHLLALLASFLFGLPTAGAAQLIPGEVLEHTFSYRGILTGFMRIEIAHAEFSVALDAETIEGHEIYQASLNLTTESFGVAEILYPIRFHYRSWLERDKQVPLLVVEHLQTEETDEEILWFDHENQLGYRYEKKAQATQGQDETPPAQLLDKLGVSQGDRSGMLKSHQENLSQDAVWDYLSMLYRLRFMPLQPGLVSELPLYNGRRIKHYRAEVVRDQLQQGGWDRSAFRINLYEVQNGRQEAGAITSLWVSDDAARLPLRFYVERTFGVVEGILETGRPNPGGEAGVSHAARDSSDLFF